MLFGLIQAETCTGGRRDLLQSSGYAANSQIPATCSGDNCSSSKKNKPSGKFADLLSPLQLQPSPHIPQCRRHFSVIGPNIEINYYCGLPGKRSIGITVPRTLSGQKNPLQCRWISNPPNHLHWSPWTSSYKFQAISLPQVFEGLY